jgi:Fur family ferric uptake transcriptional regulator
MHHYANLLHSQGLRLTPQRLAVLHILEEAPGHLSAIEIIEKTQTALPGMTEPTVYRALNFLTEQGLILSTVNSSGQVTYEIADHAHHHLVCRNCQRTIEIDHAIVEALYQQFQHLHGFQIDSVHLTFVGLCPECKIHPC